MVRDNTLRVPNYVKYKIKVIWIITISLQGHVFKDPLSRARFTIHVHVYIGLHNLGRFCSTNQSTPGIY